MKTNAFPPIPTSAEWAKLDSIQSSIQTCKSNLNNLSVRPDGMGIDQMVVRLNHHQSFTNDRQGPFGWLFRWFQTGR
jgi:hypothetical protein